ncbi:MAG: 30S ribosomal protein S16, partial [Leptospiraceae bacterium]|nr:30S ribosomal protein S16 [Leptospiraceae bacterium]
MVVKLRLQRFGTKKRPYYRIVAATSTVKRDGKFLDILGLYHPLVAEEKQLRVDKEKVMAWLSRGAQPTDTVKSILSKTGIWQEFASAKALRAGERR